MTTPIRLVLAGDDPKQSLTFRKSWIDALTGSGYLADGSDFAGWAKLGASYTKAEADTAFAPIAHTHAANTLTGTVLASGVVTSSLTGVGILAAPHMTSPVVDSGGLTVAAGGLTVTAGLLSGAGARFSGSSVAASGSGVEVMWNGSTGIINAFDRTGSGYLPITYGASLHTFAAGGISVTSGAVATRSAVGGFVFDSRTDATQSWTLYASTNSARLFVASIDVMTVTSSGALTTKSAITVQAGGLTVTAGGLTVSAGNVVAGGGQLNVSGAAGTQRRIDFQTGGSSRWAFLAGSGAETGANAGSTFGLQALDDTGAFIDTCITILRPAGGTMTLSRPTAFSSTVGFNGTAPVAKPTLAAAATDLATALTLVNDLRTRLINYGLAA